MICLQRRMRAPYEVIVATSVLMLFAGCGGGVEPPPKLAPASGTVTRDGKPLVGVSVGFYPDSDKGTKGPASFGKTDQEGYFELSVASGQKGAVIGKHKITLSCPAPSGSEASAAPAPAVPCNIPGVMGNADTTKLTGEVTAEGTPLIIDVAE